MSEPAKKDVLRDVFTRSAEGYGRIRYFPLFGQWLVDLARIPRGASVLDVACGRGAVLHPAADATGPSGRVIGIDLAEGMVRETNAELRHRGIRHAEARTMDAEHLEFAQATFDRVLCGFSLHFLPRLGESLAGFRRALKPNGLMAATSWGKDDNRWEWFDDLLASHGAVLKLQSQRLDSPRAILDWFGPAGFKDIQVAEKPMDMVYVDEEEWWGTRSNTSGRAGLERLGPDGLSALKAEAFSRMQAQRMPDGFHVTLLAYCVVATNE